MKTAYCGHCRKVTVMTVTVTDLPVADHEGKVKKTRIEQYHCSVCGSSACSEEKEPAELSVSRR
jgi:hypothetical protein